MAALIKARSITRFIRFPSNNFNHTKPLLNARYLIAKSRRDPYFYTNPSTKISNSNPSQWRWYSNLELDQKQCEKVEGWEGFPSEPNTAYTFVDATHFQAQGEAEGVESQSFIGGVFTNANGLFAYFAKPGKNVVGNNTYLAEEYAVIYADKCRTNFEETLDTAFTDHKNVSKDIKKRKDERDLSCDVKHLDKNLPGIMIYSHIGHVLAALAKWGILRTEYTRIPLHLTSPRAFLLFLYSKLPLYDRFWRTHMSETQIFAESLDDKSLQQLCNDMKTETRIRVFVRNVFCNELRAREMEGENGQEKYVKKPKQDKK